MHDGPRAQKTARATGARPGVLTEPEPQGGAVTVGYVAPFLSSPMLADAAAEAVDARTVKYLLKAALRRREEEGLGEEGVGDGVGEEGRAAAGCHRGS